MLVKFGQREGILKGDAIAKWILFVEQSCLKWDYEN